MHPKYRNELSTVYLLGVSLPDDDSRQGGEHLQGKVCPSARRR